MNEMVKKILKLVQIRVITKIGISVVRSADFAECNTHSKLVQVNAFIPLLLSLLLRSQSILSKQAVIKFIAFPWMQEVELCQMLSS